MQMGDSPILIGKYLGSGACGSAFEIEGDSTKVIKIARLIDYKYGKNDELEISSIKNDPQNNYSGWLGGIALNEFQAVLFEKLAEMTIANEEYTTTLPKTFAFTSGEMTQELLDDIDKSHNKYGWDRGKFREFMNSFTVGDIVNPGTRIGMWIIERVEKVGVSFGRAKHYEQLNKWLIEHNMVVRDTMNEGNFGYRDNGDVVWFDAGVCPWPIQKDWGASEDVKKQNMYYGFGEAFAGRMIDTVINIEIDKYNTAIETGNFIKKWWQAEDEADIIRFVAESEVIGDYIDAGAAGSVYALNGDKILKIVRLNHTFNDQDINKDQAEFIEDVYLRKKGGETISPHFVNLYHYNRGDATKQLTEIINEKAEQSHSILKEGEPIALWIMERLPYVGKASNVFEGKLALKEWAKSIGYDMYDLHDGNYGSREDGTFVAFDPWPSKR